jgi:predicted nucleic acid-binding protein
VIVVDTTVWIDFFNGAGTPEDRHLQQLITAGRSLALTDLIFCEILQGIREGAAFEQTRGLTVRKTIDCLIAALCIEEEVALFHKDADFDAIACVTPLWVYRHPGGRDPHS